MVFLALLLDFRCFLAQSFRFLSCRLHLLALLLQLCQNIFKVLIAFIHQIVCFFQYFLSKAQLTGNGEGVGLPGNADQQLIGRTQRLYVKFTGGIDDLFSAHGVQF